jgi:ectoine hydroxylase-related dioxygenase (phytanoyl-CoA dioxygenase family)
MTTTYAPSDQDLDDFREVGWFLAPDVFSAHECDAALEHIEQAAFELALGEAADGRLSYRPMMHLTSPELTAVATDARWAPIVLPLLGTGDARLYWEQAVAKPPQARTELPWHQDNGYTPLVPEEYVTCWLALDDAVEANGCLWVIPGSHHDGTQRHVNGGSGPFRVGHAGPAADGICVPVPKGSVLVFSSLLMHRSGPNTTDDPRRAWILQYCSAAARSALSGKVLDDRLLLAHDGVWLDEPVRQREFDLLAVLANYDQR